MSTTLPAHVIESSKGTKAYLMSVTATLFERPSAEGEAPRESTKVLPMRFDVPLPLDTSPDNAGMAVLAMLQARFDKLNETVGTTEAPQLPTCTACGGLVPNEGSLAGNPCFDDEYSSCLCPFMRTCGRGGCRTAVRRWIQMTNPLRLVNLERKAACKACLAVDRPLSACRQCGTVFYCSAECARKDRANHVKNEGCRAPCRMCGRREETRSCSRCHLVWYCSVACQRTDWARHKQADCTPVAPPATTAAPTPSPHGNNAMNHIAATAASLATPAAAAALTPFVSSTPGTAVV